MAVDPRQVLDRAAQTRTRCHLLTRGAKVVSGAVVRVERDGVVVAVPKRAVTVGADVSVQLAVDGTAWRFEAAVLRGRVPVPDRAEEGVLLGYIGRFQRDADAAATVGGRRVDVLPAVGRGVSLLRPPARLMRLDLTGCTFTVPAGSPLVFVENAEMQAVLADPSAGRAVASARVDSLHRVDGALVYELSWVDVDDPDRLRVLVSVLAPG